LSKKDEALLADFNDLRRSFEGLLRKSGEVEWSSKTNKKRMRLRAGDKWLSSMSDAEAFDAYKKSTRRK